MFNVVFIGLVNLLSYKITILDQFVIQVINNFFILQK